MSLYVNATPASGYLLCRLRLVDEKEITITAAKTRNTSSSTII
jgi:hypothetical protein